MSKATELQAMKLQELKDMYNGLTNPAPLVGHKGHKWTYIDAILSTTNLDQKIDNELDQETQETQELAQETTYEVVQEMLFTESNQLNSEQIKALKKYDFYPIVKSERKIFKKANPDEVVNGWLVYLSLYNREGIPCIYAISIIDPSNSHYWSQSVMFPFSIKSYKQAINIAKKVICELAFNLHAVHELSRN
jgi:hypothetical protein